jgi:hypothetical protein
VAVFVVNLTKKPRRRRKKSKSSTLPPKEAKSDPPDGFGKGWREI